MKAVRPGKGVFHGWRVVCQFREQINILIDMIASINSGIKILLVSNERTEIRHPYYIEYVDRDVGNRAYYESIYERAS